MDTCWKSCKNAFSKTFKRLLMKKGWPETESRLDRCLTSFDAYCLCMGAIIRSIFWELPIEVERQGNNVLFSTAAASIFIATTAATYAELASLYPAASATYDFTYHCMGELPAFLVGWSILFNSAVRLISVTSYFGEAIEHALLKSPPTPANYDFMFVLYGWEWHLINPKKYTDVYSLGLVVIFMVIFILRVRISKIINNFFVIFGFIAGIVFFLILWFSVNWWDAEYTPFQNLQELYQFFYGCFFVYFGFLDFDVLLCIGEEIKEPRTSIPKVILTVLKHVILSFLGILVVCSAAKAVRGTKLDNRLPFVTILAAYGLPSKNLLLIIGSFCTVLSTIYSRIYLISRVLYTMSKDGLLIKWFSHINNCSKTPLFSFLVILIITLFTTLFLKPTRLIMRTSKCGYLFVKIMATISLLVSRYTCEGKTRRKSRRWVLINARKTINVPTLLTERLAMRWICILVLSIIITTILLRISIAYVSNDLTHTALLLSIIFVIVSSLLLNRQPEHQRQDVTKYLIGSPFTASISLLFDMTMIVVAGFPPMIMQSAWLALGVVHYFLYSIFFSTRRKDLAPDKENTLKRTSRTKERSSDHEEDADRSETVQRTESQQVENSTN